MNKRTIEVTVEPTGGIIIEAVAFKGADCEKAWSTTIILSLQRQLERPVLDGCRRVGAGGFAECAVEPVPEGLPRSGKGGTERSAKCANGGLVMPGPFLWRA
jgi:hypothetical protein